MIRPDFRLFKGNNTVEAIIHSAKGSTWENHKYIKRVDGTYYYPEGYEGGRHLPEGEKTSDSNKDKEDTKVFDEFEAFSKELMKKGEAYWDDEEVKNMSKEELANFYEDMTGVKLGSEDLNRLFNSREARNKPSEKETSKIGLSDKDVENLAKEVVKGNFGNGQQRKDLLGEDYAEVQKKVNEMLKGSTGSKKLSETKVTEETKSTTEKATKKVAEKTVSEKGLDLEQVYSVQRKNKK